MWAESRDGGFVILHSSVEYKRHSPFDVKTSTVFKYELSLEQLSLLITRRYSLLVMLS